MRIDAHHHVWTLADHPQTWMTPVQAETIGRDFTLQDWADAASPSGISHSVVVQTVEDATETLGLLALARESSTVLGVAGWIDAGTNPEGQLDRVLDHPGSEKLVSVRDLTEYRRDLAWLAGEEAARFFKAAGKAALSVDLLIRPEHLPAAAQAVAAHPAVRFIVNHLGKPDLDVTPAADWGRSMSTIAGSPNAAIKVSGFATLAHDFSTVKARLPEYVDECLRLFGPDRMMFGSDWPVSLMGASYADLVAALQAAVASLSRSEQESIWHSTASRWYGLQVKEGIK
ncbi:amidohydrolase family protein [Arthrobacter sp. D1-17]